MGVLLSADHVRAGRRILHTTTVRPTSYRRAGRPEAIYVGSGPDDRAGRANWVSTPWELRRINLSNPTVSLYLGQRGELYGRGESTVC